MDYKRVKIINEIYDKKGIIDTDIFLPLPI